MGQVDLMIAGLLVVVAALSVVARRWPVPYPIVLVTAGVVFGFVPGPPVVKLDPQVVLVVFVPPLLYGASIFANYNDFRATLRALILSPVGLLIATMCAVARAAHALIPGLPWEAAVVLGPSSRRPTARGRRDHAQPRRPEAHGQEHRGRGPVQRCDRARGLPRRGRRRRGRQLLARRRQPEALSGRGVAVACSSAPGASQLVAAVFILTMTGVAALSRNTSLLRCMIHKLAWRCKPAS